MRNFPYGFFRAKRASNLARRTPNSSKCRNIWITKARRAETKLAGGVSHRKAIQNGIRPGVAVECPAITKESALRNPRRYASRITRIPPEMSAFDDAHTAMQSCAHRFPHAPIGKILLSHHAPRLRCRRWRATRSADAHGLRYHQLPWVHHSHFALLRQGKHATAPATRRQ